MNFTHVLILTTIWLDVFMQKFDQDQYNTNADYHEHYYDQHCIDCDLV